MSAAEHDLVAIPATTGQVGLDTAKVEELVELHGELAGDQAMTDWDPADDDGTELTPQLTYAAAMAERGDHRVGLRTLIPRRTVSVPAFAIDRTRVTNRMYARFMRDTGRGAPPSWTGGGIPAGREGCPVTHVSHKDAYSYATWAGLELPSEVEWEIAASGGDGRRYPWGNDARPELEILRRADAAALPADAHPALASKFGVLGMVWPTWEWCYGAFEPLPGGDVAAFKEAYPDAVAWRALRGGHSYRLQYAVWSRIGAEASSNRYRYGFRCVKRGV